MHASHASTADQVVSPVAIPPAPPQQMPAITRHIHWFLAPGDRWFSVISKPNESAGEAMGEARRNPTYVACERTQGMNPGEVMNLIWNAVHQPHLSQPVSRECQDRMDRRRA